VCLAWLSASSACSRKSRARQVLRGSLFGDHLEAVGQMRQAQPQHMVQQAFRLKRHGPPSYRTRCRSVQRLPTPPAKVTTATDPDRRASCPSFSNRAGNLNRTSKTCSGLTFSIRVETGSCFWANSMHQRAELDARYARNWSLVVLTRIERQVVTKT